MSRSSSGAQRNWGTKVREYARQGMPLVDLENELLRVFVLDGKE